MYRSELLPPAELSLKCLWIVSLLSLTGCSSSSSTNTMLPEQGENNTGALADRLTVVSWGGTYEQSQVKAFHEPWTAQTGVPINSVSYSGSLDELRTKVNSGNVDWDIVDIEPNEAVAACAEGLIDPIDKTRLKAAPDGTPAMDDFFPGTLFDCAVANIVWSTVVVYNTNLLTSPPTSIADFFNTDAFAGNRGVRQSPETILEMALIADGVDPQDVYSTLSTDAGVDRAFLQLDAIKNNIVWWGSGLESIDNLKDQSVVMSTVYNSRGFNAIHQDQSALAMMWDGQIWNLDVWVLPNGSTRRETAYNFLAAATATEALAAQASYIAYGPVRRSSQGLVGVHVEYGVDMKPFIPTSAENFQNALQFDVEFWNTNRARLNARFEAWMQGS